MIDFGQRSFDLASGALAEQERLVSEVRGRGAAQLAAGAVVPSLLAHTIFHGLHPVGPADVIAIHEPRKTGHDAVIHRMLMHRHVPQPSADYRELFRLAGGAAQFDEVAGAFAYATSGGAEILLEALSHAIPSLATRRVDKRWLLGIDWCRTEPGAFDILNDPARSQVRIHDGVFVVGRQGCTPRLPWHPKVLLLRSADAIGVVAGSGNMSRNGLTKGHEAGAVTVVARPRNAQERDIWNSCQEMFDWFEHLWRTGTPNTAIAASYANRFRDRAREQPPVTDGDTLPERSRNWTEERVRTVRTAAHLWIDSGNLHRNRGPNLPGDQLMLSAFTRVFFGFPAEDLPTDSALGTIAIQYAGSVKPDCSLRYSNNSMDVLTLPVPAAGGPPGYDQETLRFTRNTEDGRPVFELTLATGGQRRLWKRASVRNGSLYVMRNSPREWGVIP